MGRPVRHVGRNSVAYCAIAQRLADYALRYDVTSKPPGTIACERHRAGGYWAPVRTEPSHWKPWLTGSLGSLEASAFCVR